MRDDDLLEGLTRFAQALKRNTGLKKLRLSGNDFGDEGVEVLAGALKFNASLETLALGSNEIGHSGMLYLSRALKVNSTLKGIQLYDKNRRITIAFSLLFFSLLASYSYCNTIFLCPHKVSSSSSNPIVKVVAFLFF